MLETHTVQLQHEGLSASQKTTFFVSAALRASLGYMPAACCAPWTELLLLLHLPTQGW